MNSTIKKTTTSTKSSSVKPSIRRESQICTKNKFSSTSRLQKRDVLIDLHAKLNKYSNGRNAHYQQKVSDFLERIHSKQEPVFLEQRNSKRTNVFLRQKHSSTSMDLTYIFPIVKSILGKLKEDELKYLGYRVLYKAEELIKKLRSISKKNKLWWYKPLLNISIENEIVLEWWHKEKKLTIYVCPNTIDFIKVWGADMDDEMEDGSIDLSDNLSDNDAILSLWQWIAS